MTLTRKCLLKLYALDCCLANHMNANRRFFHWAAICGERIFVLSILYKELSEQLYVLLFLLKAI